MKSKYKLVCIAVFSTITLMLASCAAELPPKIYDAPIAISSETEEEKTVRLNKLSQETMNEDIPLEFSQWLPEELDRYNFIKQAWQDFRMLAEKIKTEDKSEELVSIRKEVIKKIEDASADTEKYWDWYENYKNSSALQENTMTNQELKEKRNKINEYLSAKTPRFRELLDFLPYDGDWDFQNKWDNLYSKIESSNKNLKNEGAVMDLTEKDRAAVSKIYKDAMTNMKQVKSLYEKGEITGEQASNAVVNIYLKSEKEVSIQKMEQYYTIAD